MADHHDSDEVHEPGTSKATCSVYVEFYKLFEEVSGLPEQ